MPTPMDAHLENTIRRFYAGHLADRGGALDDPRSLGWTSRERQEARFEALCACAGVTAAPDGARTWVTTDGDGNPLPWAAPEPCPSASVLDAGCGFGDLYGWLRARGSRAPYRGADLVPEMAEGARTKWPDAAIDLGDPSALYPEKSFDWVLASGYVCVYAGQARVAHLRSTAAALLALSRVGTAFNLLDARALVQEGALLTYLPDEALAACHGLAPRVEIVMGYLDNDFTVVLRR